MVNNTFDTGLLNGNGEGDSRIPLDLTNVPGVRNKVNDIQLPSRAAMETYEVSIQMAGLLTRAIRSPLVC
jgi:hypothetical protein